MAVDHDAADFLHDLHSNVCLIVPEGLDYAFSHRSFQEYFAAYCMAYVTAKNFEKFVQVFARRPNDQVIRLLVDMAPEKFRDLYIVPMAERFADNLKTPVNQKRVARYFKDTGASFFVSHDVIEGKNGRRYSISLDRSGDLNDVVELFHNLGGGRRLSARNGDGKDRDAQDVADIFSALGIGLNKRVRFFSTGDDISVEIADKRAANFSDEKRRAGVDRFKSSRMYEFMDDRLRVAAKYADAALAQGRKSSAAMDSIFDF